MVDQIPPSQIDDELYLVLRTIWQYEHSLLRSYGLDYQRINALLFLQRQENARITDISAELGLPMFATSRMVDRLVAKGYVRKARDAGDRRNLQVHLEPAGEEILLAFREASLKQAPRDSQNLASQKTTKDIGTAGLLRDLLGVIDPEF